MKSWSCTSWFGQGLPTTAVNIFLRRNRQVDKRFRAAFPGFLGHGSKAGYSAGVAGVDARRATPLDPRPPHWGLAGCCQLDPSHPTIVTCEVGREGRHAPRPNDVGGPTTFPGRQKGGDPAASGDLRRGHRAPGRGGRRALIPPHALSTLLSALWAFCLWEFRVFSTNLNILRFICSVNRYPAQRAGDTFCPRSDGFWLLELRVSRTCTYWSGQWSPPLPVGQIAELGRWV